MGLLETLGLKKPKKLATAAAAGGAGDAPPPLSAQQGAALLDAATAYSKALAEAQAKLAALGDPRLAKARIAIEAAVLAPARATAKAGRYPDAIAQLARVDDAVQAAQGYLAARAAVDRARAALAANVHQAHVTREIQAADRQLAEAQKQADGAHWDAASAALLLATTACRDGEGFARRFAECVARSAQVEGLVIALATAQVANAAETAARAAADLKAGNRDYDGAKAGYDAVFSAAEAQHQVWKQQLVTAAQAVRTGKGGSFSEPQLQRVDGLIAQMDAAIVAHQWRKAVMLYQQVAGLNGVAARLAQRASDYADQRVITAADIDKLKTDHKSLLGQVVSLNVLLGKADALASREQLLIEDGIKALKDISATCVELVKVAEGSAGYVAERKLADDALALLEKHVAADKIAAEIAAIRTRLAAAGKQAGDLGNAGPRGVVQSDAGSQDFAAARATLAQASADLATAQKIADGLIGVAAVEKAAAKPDAKGAEAALAALQKDLAAAHAAPHGDLVGKDLLPVDNAVDAVRKLIDAKKPQDAVRELVLAAQTLADALRKKVEAANNTALRESLDKRMKALKDSPEGPGIAARITDVTKLTEEAAALDRDAQFVTATAKLHLAEVAATRAEQAAAERKLYADKAKAVKALADARANAAIKPELEKALLDAAKAADAFDFGTAGKTLTAAENRAKAAQLERASQGASPNVAAVKAEAIKLMESGGAKELDALIARLPANASVAVLDALAETRFGIKFEEEAGGSDGKQGVALKGMCKLMAQVPDDVLDNPALKKISRKGTRPFPFYEAGKKEVVMNSHPGKSSNPMFPTKPAGVSDADWKLQQEEQRKQTLGDVEESCKPANDKPEDYFDFNFLHEVAHAIDDARQFMASHERQSAYGGWISHGADVDSIAAAVCKAKGFDKAPEQIAYVTARIAGGKADAPPRPDVGGDAFDAAKKAVDDWHTAATSANVWRNQSLISTLDIKGRVYHLAYAESQTWVSYETAARSRGITGYQFRAPGEWFSELYAAYKSGKLKKDHPSASWLAELSI